MFSKLIEMFKQKKELPNSGAVPSFCLMVVNKSCNFRCRMCNMWNSGEVEGTLSLDEMKRCVRELSEFVDEPIFIHLIGGETLLWPHTCELASYIVEHGFRTSITTNGSLIDKKMAEDIVASGISGVFISLDSLSAEKHDYIRGHEGAFRKANEAVDYLYAEKQRTGSDISIGHTFTIMESNLDEILPMASWVESNNKVDSLFFNAVMQPFDSGEDSPDWIEQQKYKEIWPQDMPKLLSILDKLKDMAGEDSCICNPPEQVEVLKEYFKSPYKFRQNMGIKCTRGDLALEINAFGDVAMCFYMPPIANVREKHLRDIWYSDELVSARDFINHCDKDCDLAVNCFYKIENITDYVK